MRSIAGQRLRMTREDRKLRKMRARKVTARIEFLDEPFRETIQATCGVCGRRLGWWPKDDTGNWRSQPLIAYPRATPWVEGDLPPGEGLLYSYSGYEDTGYEVIEIHRKAKIDHAGSPDGQRPPRIRSTGGHISAGGERFGRRPRTNDAYLNIPGFQSPGATVGEVVELPADVYCPSCERDTLNRIEAPSSGA